MANNMFIRIGNIVGESQDRSYPGWIDVLAWSWGTSSSGSLHAGPGGGAGAPSVQDLSITKWIDRSSEDLLRLLATGQTASYAYMLQRRGTATDLILYCTPVIVTSLSCGGSAGEDRLTENVTLNFSQYRYYYRDPVGGTGYEGTGWDIPGNRLLF